MKHYNTIFAFQAGAWPLKDSYDSPIGKTTEADTDFVLGASLLLVIGFYWIYRKLTKNK